MTTEETIIHRFSLNPEASKQTAAETVAQAIKSALGGTCDAADNGAISGTGLASKTARGMRDITGFEKKHKIKISGAVKEQKDGEFTALISLKHDGQNAAGQFFKAGAYTWLFFGPLLGFFGVWFLFRGAVFPALIGAVIGLFAGVAIVRAFLQEPQKALQVAKQAIETKLTEIEIALLKDD